MTRFRWLLASLLALALPGTLAWGQSVVSSDYEVPAAIGLFSQAADEAERAEKYLEMWQLLWSCELYHEAEKLAAVAAQSCPSSVQAQHAFIVSQIVNAIQSAVTPEMNVPVRVSTSDLTISSFPYPLTNVQEFGVEIGLHECSAAVEPKAEVKGCCKWSCRAAVKPACAKSAGHAPDGVVRCQYTEEGASGDELIGGGLALLADLFDLRTSCCQTYGIHGGPCAAKCCAKCTKDGCCTSKCCPCEARCSGCGNDCCCEAPAKAACACGKDCCCAKKACACGKDCACGKTVSHCPWLLWIQHHPRAALRILHAPLLPEFVHGMMPPPHMPAGCMPMPCPALHPLPPHALMMPPFPVAAPFTAFVSSNGQFVRWGPPCPGMQAAQCLPAPVAIPAVAEQLPMPREVGVAVPHFVTSRPVAGQPMPPCSPFTPVMHHDIGLPPAAGEPSDRTVRFRAMRNGIHVSNSQFDARCDHVTTCDNNRILLEGNVHVEIRRENMPACIEAESVAVNLRDGSFEVNPPKATSLSKPLSIPGQPVNRTMYVPNGPYTTPVLPMSMSIPPMSMPTRTPCQSAQPDYKCEPLPNPQSLPRRQPQQ